MKYDIVKVLTENPYIDELIYQVKIMSYGCILKNNQKALENETRESINNAGIYIACKDGVAKYNTVDYTQEMFDLLPSIQKTVVDSILEDKENLVREKVIYSDTNGIAVDNRITTDQRKLIVSTAIQYTIDNYVELNNYYRELNGEPNFGEPGIKVGDFVNWIPPENIISQESLNNKYIHEMESTEISILEDYGILDKIRAQVPDKVYLHHLFPKKVSYYNARKAYPFQVLFIPQIEQNTIYQRFKERLDINREYTTKTIYSDAYKFNSSYYDSVMMVLIVVQTIIDMMSEVQEIITNKDILDLRSIQYIFESYGIPFFSEIPLKYQISLVKNINILLKYKSTAKNITDILTLFGFKDIEVFKYYLIKDRKVDKDGNYILNGANNSDNYELSFIKVPVKDNNPDSYLKKSENKIKYNEIISNDITWNGGLVGDIVKNDILNHDFNYVSTKYISIDTMYKMSELSFQVPYFFNTIFDHNKIAETLTLSIPFLSEDHSFKLTDIFVYLFSLAHIYYGYDDNIITNGIVITHILGFNFDIDLPALENDLHKAGFDYNKLMEGNKFIVPNTAIGYEQLFDLISTNQKTLSFIKSKLFNSSNKREYDAYSKIYNACMIKKYTNDYYKVDIDGESKVPETYTEYLSYRDSILYSSISDIKYLTSNESEQKNVIINNIDKIISSIYEYIDSDDYKYIFAQFPGGSTLSMMSTYVYKIIDFFKSYKIDFLGVNTNYVFNDRFGTGISYIDNISFSTTYNKRDILKYTDMLKMTSNLKYSDRINFNDFIFIKPTK